MWANEFEEEEILEDLYMLTITKSLCLKQKIRGFLHNPSLSEILTYDFPLSKWNNNSYVFNILSRSSVIHMHLQEICDIWYLEEVRRDTQHWWMWEKPTFILWPNILLVGKLFHYVLVLMLITFAQPLLLTKLFQ